MINDQIVDDWDCRGARRTAAYSMRLHQLICLSFWWNLSIILTFYCVSTSEHAVGNRRIWRDTVAAAEKKKRYWRTPSHNNCVMSRVGGEIQHQQLEWSWVGVLVRVSADPLASVQVKAHSRNHRLEVKTRGETWGRRGEGEWGCVLRPLCEDISLILSKSHTTVAFDAPAAWPAAVEKLCNTCAPPVFLG